MKQLVIIMALFFSAVITQAQQPRQHQHGIRRSDPGFRHPTFDSARDSFASIEPVKVDPINSDSVRNSFEEKRVEPIHLDFGSRPLENFQHLSDTFDDYRNNERYSNMRMQFEDQRLDHLNFNAQ